jgi:cytochrome P450
MDNMVAVRRLSRDRQRGGQANSQRSGDLLFRPRSGEKPWRPPSLVLERDPPDHDRACAVLNRALSATVMRALRARFVEAADELASRWGERAASMRSPTAPKFIR